ncbi:hypothetical protein EON63_18000, partial [archaeon]
MSERYQQGHYYTTLGPMLLACLPHKPRKLTLDNTVIEYIDRLHTHLTLSLPPHTHHTIICSGMNTPVKTNVSNLITRRFCF